MPALSPLLALPLDVVCVTSSVQAVCLLLLSVCVYATTLFGLHVFGRVGGRVGGGALGGVCGLIVLR